MTELFTNANSIAEILRRRSDEQASKLALRFISENSAETFTYKQLDTQARKVAAALQQSVSPGDRVILLFPSGQDYVTAFFGCLYANVIAVPAYPPESSRQHHLERLLSIVKDAAPRLILTSSFLKKPLLEAMNALGIKHIQLLAVDSLEESLADTYKTTSSEPDQIAFLQYTSGSTALPKGVQVTQANLIANEILIRRGFEMNSDDVIVSWLPLYHDMGLIGGLLQGIYSGVPVVLMAPEYFLVQPIRWLEAISQYRGTVSGAPDFGYRLCYERINEAKMAGLDLSSWRLAFSGSEPIRKDSLEQFTQKFSVAGFQRTSLFPCYGLAEATLFVTGARRGQGVNLLSANSQSIASNRFEKGSDAEIISCGYLQPDHQVALMDPQTLQPQADDHIGEIWISGASVAQGYWHNKEATDKTFVEHDGRRWLRTGDMGFCHQGELYVTGRLKDMLIIRGQNVYPQDIERTIEREIDAVRKGRVAAFPVKNANSEGLGIAAEISRRTQKLIPASHLIKRIHQVVAEMHGDAPCRIALLNPGALPKTSSGKLQRSACASRLEKGKLDVFVDWQDGQPISCDNEVSITPIDDIGRWIAQCWCEQLNIKTITAEDNFFALGGNSIVAVQLIAKLRERLKSPIDTRLLFESPVLKDFVATVEKAIKSEEAEGYGIKAIPRDSALIQSPAQNRLWFLWQLDPQSAAYNIPGGLRLRGELDEKAVQKSFDWLLQRHESLRTTFYEKDGIALQRVHETTSINIDKYSFKELESAERKAKILEFGEAEARKPFDLEKGPLIRVSLVEHDEEDYLLLVTMHHIITDGWSVNILMREFALAYAEYSQNREPTLSVNSIQYADYATWQNEWLKTGEKDKQLAYWRKQLEENVTPTSLIADKPRTSKSYQAKRMSLSLEQTLVQQLKEIAKEQRTTLFTVFLGAFQILLSRYIGQKDVQIGVPNANREHPQIQNLIGFFINPLVMLTGIDSDESFNSLIERLNKNVLAAQANQALPFEQITQVISNGDKDISLFQILFNHQQRDLSPLRRLPGLIATELPWHSRDAKYELQLHTEEDEKGRIQIAFDYAVELFEVSTIERLAKHFIKVLEIVSQNPEGKIKALSLIDDSERNQITEWGWSEKDYWPTSIVQIIEAQAGVHPNRIALISGDKKLTYSELENRANRLAHYLRNEGVKPEVRVGIALERSHELIIALLAVLKAGGAYVPLDIDYPKERINYMLNDSKIKLLLTSSQLGFPLIDHGIKVVSLDALDTESFSQTPLHTEVDDDNLAYIIYTSGSTGLPKGVGVTHLALRERLQWMQETYNFDESDVFLQKAPISFDVSVWECFLPLMTGSRLVLAAPGDHRDPQKIIDLTIKEKVTTLHFVPSLMRLFIDEQRVSDCISLKRLFSGGEVLSTELQNRIFAKLPNAQLQNRYGPTETAINVTYWPCCKEDYATIPIGRPLGNVKCSIMDDEFDIAPIGISGELCIGGTGLARGYLGRPALTAERFLPTSDGGRLYRTGDAVRWRNDGALEYLGRRDQQIKLRGFRIELEEVESQLLQISGIGQSAVVIKNGVAGQQLVAYIVAKDIDTQTIKQKLQTRLPEYMVPSQFVVLDSLPLTPSGKLDKKALPEPVWQQREFIAPRTETEKTMASIWQQVLGTESIGIKDSFFELGGHSLLATQAISRVRKACDVDIPLRALFDHHDLEGFSAQIDKAKLQGSRNSLQPIRIIDRTIPTPLSYSQQRMWFLWQLDPQSPAYNVGGVVRMTGQLNADIFENALKELIHRHETLRTVFPNEQGVPWQQVTSGQSFKISRVDLTSLQGDELQKHLHKIADDEAHKSFDLETGPLLRVCLAKTTDNENYLIVTLHHIVTEGWAMDIFARELGMIYEAFLNNKPSPLEPLPVQYLDYSVWQREWLEAGEMQRQLDYWKAQLGGEQSLLELPGDRPRPPIQTYGGELYRFALDDELATKVREFNNRHGLTMFMTMTAALAVLLYRYSGQNDLRIGAPLANRIRPESEGLIGAFLNTHVLRIQLTGDMLTDELLAQVRQTVIDGQSHQDLPFDHLVEALHPERSSAYNPLFQVMCNIQRWEFQQTRELAGLKLEYIANDARATKFDLNLEVSDLNHSLGCCFTYSTDLFDRSTIERMAKHWRGLLTALVDKTERLSELSMLDGEEAYKLTHLSYTDKPQSKTTTSISQLFEKQVEANPQAIALTVDGDSLSYSELNVAANLWAHKLYGQGVGAEMRIGVALPRSLNLVIGILAILKTGAAYVPLDPGYPQDRLRYIIEDSGIDLLISETKLFEDLAPLPSTVKYWLPLQEIDTSDEILTKNLNIDIDPQHLAYLIYTSGSTGKPKGVAVTHGPLAMHCQAAGELFGTNPKDCELHFYSINFDAATERLLVPLIFGARVVLRGQDQSDAEEICQLIRQESINVIGVTPGYGHQLAQWLASQKHQLPIRLCITGGEALTPEHLRSIRESFTPQQFFNAYGPTETVVMPLAYDIPSDMAATHGNIPIGSVVGHRTAYIFDADMTLIPPGAIGELYLGGEGLARAYHDLQALTAERFVADPFNEGERLYRTGDLVRLGRDGVIEYVTRADHQVKIRGFRIELGEIEACLQDHEAIEDAVVSAIDSPSGKQLVAYVVPHNAVDKHDFNVWNEEIKTHMQVRLPDYMVPAHIIHLQKLPLTNNGKVDRKALPLPEIDTSRTSYQQPVNDLQHKLVEIWREVLGVERIGITDNFFSLGGDSILSIQVVSRARQVDIHFTPKDLFQNQTIQMLAAVAQVRKQVFIDQGPVSGKSILTPIQQWFFKTIDKQHHHWNQSVLLEPTTSLDPQRLQQALRMLVNHHDALRLTFRKQKDNWNAEYGPMIDDKQSSLLWVSDVENKEERLKLFEKAQQSFDLENGPLLRAILCNTEPRRLLIVAHHLVIDGVSWRILLDDLQHIYKQLALLDKPKLRDRTHAFSYWAEHLQTYANRPALQEKSNWWQTHLANVKFDLPLDHPKGENTQRYAKTLNLKIPKEQTRQLLLDATPAYRTNINELLLTTLGIALSQWTNKNEVLIQLEGHGREDIFDDIDISRTVGWFTTTYPVRLKVDNVIGNSIKSIKEDLRAIPNKGIGYGILRYMSDQDTQSRINDLPAAPITFNYLGQFDQSFAEDALFHPVNETTGHTHAADSPLPNWLSIDCQIYDNELSMRWTYSSKVFADKTIQALIDRYQTELNNVIDHCLTKNVGGVTPSDFPLAKLSQMQLDELPIPFANIEDVYPLTPMQEGLLLHTLLEPGTGIYFMQDRYAIDSEINKENFAKAWEGVVARHEALRASFSWNAGESMVQIIHRHYPVRIDFDDWSHIPNDLHEEKLQQLLKDEREAGFDLLQEPPFRLRLIHRGFSSNWFVMSNHHILIDAWCRSVLMSDFFEIYSALENQESINLPAAPRYRDFIAWLQQQNLQISRDFWQSFLAGFEHPTPIPSDKPIVHDNGAMNVADRFDKLDLVTTTRLKELAQSNQLTANTFAQAAWSLVLHRYSGNHDVLFGVTVAGRPVSRPDMQNTVGLFINSIPLRIAIPMNEQSRSVGDWLHGLFERNLSVREHEHLPLVHIQECSELPKGQTLFDSLFVFENAPVQVSVLDRARHFSARSDSGRTHTNFPLTVVCYPGDELGLHLSYDTRFFDESTIERLLNDFKRLLLALVDGFHGKFTDLSLMDEAERRFLTETCNQTEQEYPLSESYVSLFESQVALHPQQPVARCLDEVWTYQGLNQAANKLGHVLSAVGVQSDQPIALLAERGLPLLGMIIGSFKAGAGYLPLDPSHPDSRLTQILTSSHTPVLVCTQECLEQAKALLLGLSGDQRITLFVWEDIQSNTQISRDNPGYYTSSQHLAYVIYTSGSTGQPKGVMVEQAGMLNNQLSKVPYLKLGKNDIIAQTASQSFDISVWQFLTAPLCGAQVDIIPKHIAHDPVALLQHIQERKITVLESVPSLIQSLLLEDDSQLNHLRWLLPTGEAMPPALAKDWMQRYPAIPLVNAYGPAECSDDVALFQVNEESTQGSYLPIGTPTDNNRIYLLDDHLNLVPQGAIGELCIAGTGVGRGYLNDPIKTAQSFLPNPYSQTDGERLYRSGDLAKRRQDGVLEYVGRNDHQVKIRGFRIELGEIEARLLTHEQVREAVVVAQTNPSGPYLVGYVVLEDNESETDNIADVLKNHLKAHLPDYMVPGHIFQLEKLPLNPNGKVDRKSLPLPDLQGRVEDYIAPRNELETKLAEIWQDVLKVERVGVRDNFFELGGHSLLATQIASRTQKALKLSIPLRAMFESNTVEDLANYIDSISASAMTEQTSNRLNDLMSQLETL